MGEQLGQAVAGLVILNMRATEAGYENGYAWGHYAAHHCPMPQRLAYVPDPFGHQPVLTDSYRRAFAEGWTDYRTEHRTEHRTQDTPATP